MGFLADWRRLNVMLTRARRGMRPGCNWPWDFTHGIWGLGGGEGGSVRLEITIRFYFFWEYDSRDEMDMTRHFVVEFSLGLGLVG